MTSPTPTAPVVETERLLLRPYRMPDFDSYAAFFASDRARFLGGPHDRRTAWGEFAGDFVGWSLRGAGMWAIELRATGALVGWVGVIEPPSHEAPELCWFVLDRFEGQGLAFEAAVAARDTARTTLRRDGLISVIADDDTRSIRLAERMQARRDGTRDNVVGRFRGLWHVYRHQKGAV